MMPMGLPRLYSHPPEIEFVVYGRPASQGSKKAFMIGGHARIRESNSDRQQQWYNAVASVAAGEMDGGSLFIGPIVFSAVFYFKRPKAHYRTGKYAGILKDSAPGLHIQKPDLGKLIRCTEDALSAVLWRDDSQVCEYFDCRKEWTEEQERATIRIYSRDAESSP